MGLFGKGKPAIKTAPVVPAVSSERGRPRKYEKHEKYEKYETTDAEISLSKIRASGDRKRKTVTSGDFVKYAATDRYSVNAYVFCTHGDGTVDLQYKDLRAGPDVITKTDVAGSDGSETGTWFVD